MRGTLLAALLASNAAAQLGEGISSSTPTDENSGRGVKVATAVTPKLKRPIHAVIHKKSADWEPVSLRAGGDPGQAATTVLLKLVK
ncbi:MAG: hypothetical protein HYZ74_07265, partial [Elusimicrobia bacterium]|nr:hypothetical protein [Elusimicrobiota bacterium]